MPAPESDFVIRTICGYQSVSSVGNGYFQMDTCIFRNISIREFHQITVVTLTYRITHYQFTTGSGIFVLPEYFHLFNFFSILDRTIGCQFGIPPIHSRFMFIGIKADVRTRKHHEAVGSRLFVGAFYRCLVEQLDAWVVDIVGLINIDCPMIVGIFQ